MMTAQLPEAFYIPVGENEFDSTRATESPWDPRAQHGGPPAALLARAVELSRPDDEMPIMRLATDMLGPIPQGRIRTEATIVRPGKRVEMVEAKLYANDQLAVSATAWRIRRSPGSTADFAHHIPGAAIPEPQEQLFFPGLDPNWGYGKAIEWRFLDGSLQELGPADVWTRVRIPLVAGEEITPTQRAAIVADAANGLSGELPLSEWLFIPPSMAMTFVREPVGEWMHLAAWTTLSDSGTGLTQARMHDENGFFCEVNQPLLVAPR